MKHYYDVALNPRGPIPNPTVTVYVAGTNQGTLATIFSDDGITSKVNPFTGDALGNFDFYVADGRYDLKMTGQGVTTRLETDIEIADITQFSSGDATAVFGALTAGSYTGASGDRFDVTHPSYGAVCDGVTNDTAAIQAAITAAKVKGGTVYIPNGKTCVFTTTLDASSSQGVSIVGGFDSATDTNGNSPILLYTGTATPAINFGTSTGFNMRRVRLKYNNAGFTGVLIEGHSASSTAAAFFDGVSIGSTAGGPNTASVCLSLDTVIASTVQRSSFDNCAVGIRGAATNGSFSNANIIGPANRFSTSTGDISTAMIQNPTQGWTICGNTFELGSGQGNNSILNFTGTVQSQGLQFCGNWSGDSNSTGARTLLSLIGAGISITGNFFGGNQTNDTVINVPNGTFVQIAGNQFTGALVAISAAVNARIFGGGNFYSSVTTDLSGVPSLAGMVNLANDRIDTFGKWIFNDQILANPGTVSAPGMSFNTASNMGWFFNSNTRVQAAAGGVAGPMVDQTGWFLGSGMVYKWENSTDPNAGAVDTGCSRIAANVVGCGNGTQGDVSGEVRSAKISATYNAAGTVQTAVHLVQDTCTLGTNCAITLSGSAAFTSATSYTCTCHDQTTPLNACGVNQTGGGALTITGTGTDVIRYLCVGN